MALKREVPKESLDVVIESAERRLQHLLEKIEDNEETASEAEEYHGLNSALDDIRSHLKQSKSVISCPDCGREWDAAIEYLKEGDACPSDDCPSNCKTAEACPSDRDEKTRSVMMQDIVGDYDTPDTVPEWSWVERVASFSHVHNGERDGIWEFVLNLGNAWNDIPERLSPVIAQARADKVAYLIVHQGT